MCPGLIILLIKQIVDDLQNVLDDMEIDCMWYTYMHVATCMPMVLCVYMYSASCMYSMYA